MFVRLTSSTIAKPTWVATGHVQAVTSSPRGGSRIKMLDGWVEVSDEPDDVIRLIEQAVADRMQQGTWTG